MDYRQHGHWPKPGGFDAQDTALVADFQTLTKRFNWHMRQIQKQEEGQDPAEQNLRDLDVGKFVGAIAGVERRDWRDILGE